MSARKINVPVKNIAVIRRKLLAYYAAKLVKPIIALDSCGFEQDTYSKYEAIIGAGKLAESAPSPNEPIAPIKCFDQQPRKWRFGYFGYDLKNQLCQPPKATGKLASNNKAFTSFPENYWFEPAQLFLFHKAAAGICEVELVGEGAAEVFAAMQVDKLTETAPANESVVDKSPAEHAATVSLKPLTSRSSYLKIVEDVRQRIRAGDVYEINYCQLLHAKLKLNPLHLFNSLLQVSPAPFAAYFDNGEQALVCASPERFLQKRAQTLISQPIKGTAARHEDPQQDALAAKQLEQSEKDRAENIMIVDLVRNDLAKIAKSGSVEVRELCAHYRFPQVHQLISTVAAETKSDCSFEEIMTALFPMGSMTGAPKIAALQIIEEVEDFKRGLYSGAIGYINPAGDFDFNVVIRSALYDRNNSNLCIPVGGAITWDSKPEAEYEECMVKASGLAKALGIEVDRLAEALD